jgi:pimeloyl-ACP methyl ester carboxylesterase
MPRLTRLALLVSVCAAACARGAPRASTSPDVSDDAELAFAEAGTGPTLVLIHGAWGDLRSFHLAIPSLGAAHHVIAPSLRFHWPNPGPRTEAEAYATYTVERHAADVAALIEGLGVGPADIVGHSYGGAVAAHLARSRPALVRRLVLVEPALRALLRELPDGDRIVAEIAKPRPAWLARLRAGEDPVSVMKSIIDAGRPGTFDALEAEQRRILAANARTTGPIVAHPPDELPFTCEDARALRPRVLVIEGEETAPQYRAITARFVACAQGARHVTLPGAGHLIPLDAADAMARAIVAFLGD